MPSVSSLLFQLLPQTLAQAFPRLRVEFHDQTNDALVAQLLAPFVRSDIAWKMGAESVGQILTILASSLLAIATFSLSTLISSYNAAASSTTPRITTLLRQDSSAQNALGTFVGGFLFSLAGIIGMGAGLYSDSGKLVLFVVTLFVVGWLVTTFLKWIHILPRLGRVEESISLITATAKQAMENRYQNPLLGGQLADGRRKGRYDIKATASGYIAAIDVATLESSAQTIESPVYLTVTPGAWVHCGSTLLSVDVLPDEEMANRLRTSFIVEPFRTHEQDPRYGLVVLAEIAMKALSPGVNDPGTAIQVLAMQEQVLAIWARRHLVELPEAKFPHVYVPILDSRELFEDAFAGIAHYGAGDFSVMLRLQKILLALFEQGDSSFREAAREQSILALKRSAKTDLIEEERARIDGLVEGARERLAESEARVREVLECEPAQALAQANLEEGTEQVRLSGPPIMLNPILTTPFGLVLHELATNAAKYGALSKAGGKIRIATRRRPHVLELDWEETGGPPVAATSSAGFGSRLSRAAVAQLGGDLQQIWRPEGLQIRISVSLDRCLPGDRLGDTGIAAAS